MAKLIVTADKLHYSRFAMVRGEEFEASDKDAKLLKAIGKAKDWEPVVRPAHVDLPTPPVKAMEPVKETASDPNPEAGLYQRRDMRAESGRTGETTSALSSRRGRPPKAKT